MHFRYSQSTSLLISLFIYLLLVTSCGKRSHEGLIIITQAQYGVENNYLSGESWRFPVKSNLLIVNPEKPGKPAEILTSEFFSALSPEVSYDGNSIIFSGKLTENDPWQIWEMNLRNKKFRQVTTASDNCIDPAYLPGDRVVYSRYIKNDSLKGEYSLFTSNLDGTNTRRITFNPHTYFASSVLNDGRVTTISRQTFPATGKASIMVLRPDGTKSELFYQCAEGYSLATKGIETEDGRVVFIERENNNNNYGSVVSINYNRPLHSRVNHSSSRNGDFNSVAPFQNGKFLVSYRSADSERYGLYEFDPEKMAVGNMIYENSEFDIIASVLVKEHNRPRKLPSEVDTAVKTGLLLCQNINIAGMESPEGNPLNLAAGRIEIMGIDSSLGVVNVEKDGSFYLKVAADMPFTIKTIDKDGEVINGPGAWIWLRPNERRGCTGCHEDQEMVPANRYSLAVKNNPVSIPVHIKGIKEKEVELE